MFTLTLALAVSVGVFASTLCFADKAKSGSPSPQQEKAVEVPNETLKASAKAGTDWLALLDQGKYGDSWEKASSILKLTIKKEQWIVIMDATRKPNGKVKSREIIDQRVAKNPSGLPAGDYMVLLFSTSFEHKAKGKELVTLYFSDGHWNVLTYQVE